MRDLLQLNPYRCTDKGTVSQFGWAGDHSCGAFVVPSAIDKARLMIVASSGMGWDHVSVSRSNRCPNWPEMDQVRHLFFEEDETVMQLHIPAADNINMHPNCLHLWRPHKQEIPRPPSEMVGPSLREAHDLHRTKAG